MARLFNRADKLKPPVLNRKRKDSSSHSARGPAYHKF
jgi:hypothetical protein